MTYVLLVAGALIGYNIAAYFDPRGIGGDREADFSRLYLASAIFIAVATAAGCFLYWYYAGRRGRSPELKAEDQE